MAMSLSPVNEEIEETTPLLASRGTSATNTHLHPRRRASSRSPSSSQFNGTPEPTKSRKKSLFILLALIPFINFASSATVTPVVDLVKEIVCGLWYWSHGHALFENHDRDCSVQGVNSWFSGVVTVISAFESIGSLAVITFIGKKTGVYGRKPLLVGFLFIDSLGVLALPVAVWFKTGPFSLIFLAIFIFKGSLVSLITHLLLMNMMVVDWTETHARSRYLLIAQGLGALGRAPAFVLGPMLAKIFGNPLSVFYASSAALALSALVAAIFVPESLPSKYLSPSSRNEDSAPSEPQALSSHSTRQRSTSSTRKKRVENDEGWSWRSLIAPLTLLQTMMPSRSAPSEPLRYRLLLLSVALFFGHMVTTFLVQGALVYAVTIFNFNSQQTGYMLTSTSVVQIVWGLLLAPPLWKVVQGLYISRAIKRTNTACESHPELDADAERSSLLGNRDGTYDDMERLKASAVSRSDIHIASFSQVIRAASVVLVGMAKTPVLLVIGVCLHGLSNQAESAIKSAVSVSVEPSRHGEVLSALEMVSSISQVVAPIQGLILTLLINTMPQVAFFVSGSLALISAGLLMLVKDKERYDARRED